MRAGPGTALGVPFVALLLLVGCGGGDERVLTPREYADAFAEARAKRVERAAALEENFLKKLGVLEAEFGDLSGVLRDGEFDRDEAREFTESLVEVLSDITDAADDVVRDYRDDLEDLQPPESLASGHQRLVGDASFRIDLVEEVRDGIGDLGVEVENEGEFLAFFTASASLLGNLKLAYGQSLDRSTCHRLEAELAAEVGGSVDVCE